MFDKDCQFHSEVIHRIKSIEDRVEKLEDKLQKGEVADSAISQELKDLKEMFVDFKLEVVAGLKEQTTQMWKLIFILISIFGTVLGVTRLIDMW